MSIENITKEEDFSEAELSFKNKTGQNFESDKKETIILIDNFKKEKSAQEKLNILESLSKEEISDEILNFIENFSKDLIVQKEKIWEEDGEFADEFESSGDDDDTVIRPLVSRCIEILRKTKGTEYQSRGEKVLMNLLKNWNDFETDYFYDYLGESEGWKNKEQVKKSLTENEFIAMHKESGFDEKMDGFPEDIKSWESINVIFIKIKNRAIESLGEIGTRKSVDFLLDEFVSDRRSAHNKELASALDKINPEYAKEKLIELAKSDDEIVKVNAIMILYRLQFGRLEENKYPAMDSASELVCRKFYEIVNQAKLNKEEIKRLFKNEKNVSDEEIDKISKNLINKAGQMLVDFSDKIKEGANPNRKEILADLEDYKADLILTTSVYKGIDKEDGIKFEDLEGVSFEVKTADEVLKDDEALKQMLDIYAKNYAHRPAFQKELLGKFMEVLSEQGENTRLYVYRKDNKIIAFNRFDQISPGIKKFGSFNVSKIAQDSSVGRSLFKTSMKKEAPGNELTATCDVFSPASIMYIEDGKFAAVEALPDLDKETKEPAFLIKRGKESKYKYQEKSIEEIMGEYDENFSGNRYSAGQSAIIMKFKPKSGEIWKTSLELINKEGYALTRYFCSKGRKDAYLVFEKNLSKEA